MSSGPLPSVVTRTVSCPAPNGMGNGLFATTDIKTGEDVLHAKTPFVAVLDSSRLEDTCAACFGKKQMESGAELKACTGCRVVKYCDRACQSKDWKFAHSQECSIFQKLKPQVLPNNARAILRMVLRTKKGKYTAQELDIFSNLDAHLEEIQEIQAHLDRIYLSSKAVKNYSETDLSEETVMTYAAKLDLNSFNLTTAMYDRIGLYLHPYAALMNHSCDYNSTVGFDGEELFVKAIRPIKKGEQIFISYIDTTTPNEVRRKELSERYFFDCQCPKCAKGTDTLEDRFSETPKETSVLENAEKQALELMQSASTSDDKPDEAIKQLETAMHILKQTSSWPLTRQPYASIRDQLILSLLSVNNFSKAFIHAAIRYLRVDTVIFSPAHPIRHLHAWILAKLAIYLSQQGFESNSKDAALLQESDLNFHYILWYILADLASRQLESCTVPSFKRLVGNNFAQVHNEFKANGIDPSTSKAVVSAEWKKLEKIVDIALDRE
ncbi:hypothetical protein N7462_011391 [Penicillium macrosclerotiorum]|uniref:uncharacterized protein n=1 Tax=Penicillium macrosclerotiorum TaxID=303699 RepID=UPI00254885FE|nr:uncharacterized protein N7462_011391 [Penicillium macrosclerotiorum]KAJ5666982.1 hypothetical protein N7462_011391 [Penicillium macrosclerotiorum]